MPTDDDAKAIATRKLELQEAHKQLPLFDAEKHMESVRANLRPLPSKHWSRKKWHRDFMYSGWRRLLAKKDQEIADLRERILHCMGSCSDSVPTFAMLIAQEHARAEEETARREAVAATGLYTGGSPEAQPEVHGLVDTAPLLNDGVKSCSHCKSPLGAQYFGSIPNVGDLCLTCHYEWVQARGG